MRELVPACPPGVWRSMTRGLRPSLAQGAQLVVALLVAAAVVQHGHQALGQRGAGLLQGRK